MTTDEALEFFRTHSHVQIGEGFVADLVAFVEAKIAEAVAEKDREMRQNDDDNTRAFASLQAQAHSQHERAEKAEAELAEIREVIAKQADEIKFWAGGDTMARLKLNDAKSALKQARELLARSLDPFDRPDTLEEIRAFLAAHKEEKP